MRLLTEAPTTTAQSSRPPSAEPGESPTEASALSQRSRHLPYWLPRPSLALVVVLIAATATTVVLSWAQWQNYLAFLPSQGNLGNYNQAFYTTVSGQGWFYYTTNIPGGGESNLFAVHFSPTFFALAPLYAIRPSPVTLIVLKQAALAFAAVPLFGLAKVYFRKDTVPLLFALLYLVSPITTNIDWNNADPEDFLAITLLFALYFFARGRLWPFVLCWMLALGTIEAAPPLLALLAIGALIGTYVWGVSGSYWSAVQQRRPLLIALGIALAWTALAFAVLYSVGPRGGAFGASYARRYSVLGATSLPDVVIQALGHPQLAGLALQYQGGEKLLILEIILLAGGVVWVAGGLRYLLPIAALLALVFLSNATVQYTLGTEDLALLIPFLFAGLVEGSAWVSDFLARRDPDDRRAQLRSDLETAMVQLESRRSDPGVPAAASLAAGDALRSAEVALRQDRLAVSEQHLVRAGCALEVPPPPWASVPAVRLEPRSGPASVAPSPPGRGVGRFGVPRRVSALVVFAVVAISVLAVGALSSPLATAPLGGDPGRASGIAVVTPDDQVLQGMLDLVPSQASVLTTNHLFPQVSDRRDAYTVPQDRYLPANESLAEDFQNWVDLSSFVAVDYSVDAVNSELLMAESNLTGFGVYAAEGGALLYERGWTSPPTAWKPFSETLAGAALRTSDANVSTRFATGAGSTIYHAPGGKLDQRLWFGPNLIALPLGRYAVTVTLEISAPQAGNQLELNASWVPAQVTDSPEFALGGETYYAASVGPADAPATVLDQAVVSVSAPSSGYHSLTESLQVNLTATGYLSFPANELSTSMGVYLVSVAIKEVSALP
jgi:uncharacterized membrane protein